jgi:hypothetical protein
MARLGLQADGQGQGLRSRKQVKRRKRRNERHRAKRNPQHTPGYGRYSGYLT